MKVSMQLLGSFQNVTIWCGCFPAKLLTVSKHH